jgi:hypothetical protein
MGLCNVPGCLTITEAGILELKCLRDGLAFTLAGGNVLCQMALDTPRPQMVCHLLVNYLSKFILAHQENQVILLTAMDL